jgi:glycosyltransferase involved in cell wall biosynthesis
MKIFVVIPKQFAGCGFYRQWQPHENLARNGADVTIGAGVHNMDDTFGVEADIVQWHKGYFSFEGIEECKERGIITVVDFDDWWRLDTEHIFYKDYIKQDTTDKLIELLRAADYVTVTTELLAIEARRFNKNVVVLPNAMDHLEPKRFKEDKTIFGYVGGHCHSKDVALLTGLNNRLSSFKNYKLRLMGYDKSDVYNHYIDIMSDGGRMIENFDWAEKADIWNYHNFYNYMDVSLVPLVDNKFNGLKSELKLIEAGFFKKAVICSNVEPYRSLLRHKENAWVVNKPADWYKGCKFFLENPTAIQEFGEALYETVQPYSIEEVNKKRLKFYKDVLKKRNPNRSVRDSRLQAIHE